MEALIWEVESLGEEGALMYKMDTHYQTATLSESECQNDFLETVSFLESK